MAPRNYSFADRPFDGPPRAMRRLSFNLLKLLSGKAAAGLLSLVYLVIVARRLGVHDYGILTLINAYAVTVGSIVAFSGFHGIVRFGALALAEGDRARVAGIIRFMAMLELGCGLVAILVAMAAVPLVGPRLGWSGEAMHVAVPYSLAVLATVRATPQGILQLADRFDLIGLHQIVSPFTRMMGVATALLLDAGLRGYMIVWLLSSVAEGIVMWLLAWPSWRKLAGERMLGPWRGALRESRGFRRFIAFANVEITVRELAPNLVPLAVGWLIGPAAAGLLALVLRATNALAQPAVLLSQASYSVLAEQVASKARSALVQTVGRSTAVAAAAGIAALLLLAICGDRLMLAIGGASFAGAGGLTLLVGGGRAFALAATPAGAALTALGYAGRSATVVLALNLGLLPVLLVLLRWQGVVGAGWYMLVQNGLALLMLSILFARGIRRLA